MFLLTGPAKSITTTDRVVTIQRVVIEGLQLVFLVGADGILPCNNLVDSMFHLIHGTLLRTVYNTVAGPLVALFISITPEWVTICLTVFRVFRFVAGIIPHFARYLLHLFVIIIPVVAVHMNQPVANQSLPVRNQNVFNICLRECELCLERLTDTDTIFLLNLIGTVVLLVYVQHICLTEDIVGRVTNVSVS